MCRFPNFFLGLRLNRGVDLEELASRFGTKALDDMKPTVVELIERQLIERDGNLIRLTAQGRLLSNEVFQSFLTCC